MISKSNLDKIKLLIGPSVFLLVIIFPLPFLNELSIEARIVIATTILMVVWWITEIVPIYVTALLPLIIFPLLSVTSLGDTSMNYADRIVFLFLGGFLLAKAVEKANLHTRFAFNMLKFFGTNPKYIVAGFIIVTGFLSAWMSNTATAMLMLPIAIAIISQVKDKSNQKKFATCVLLSIAYSASIGGMATLIGTPPNAIFASLSQSTIGFDVSFAQWLFVGIPISAISLIVLWLYITNIGVRITHLKSIFDDKENTDNKENVKRNFNFVKNKLQSLGNPSRDEKIVLIVFIITALAWVSRGLVWKDYFPGIDDSTIVLLSAIILFFIPTKDNQSDKKIFSKRENSIYKDYSHSKPKNHPPKNNESLNSNNSEQNSKINDNQIQKTDDRLLNWKNAMEIPWGVLILIGGGLALANGFTTTGLDQWIASKLIFLGNFDIIIVIIIIVTVAIISSEILSNTATAALLIPISASLAPSIGIDPLMLMVPLTIATSFGFMMPVGTPPNAIVFATGHLSVSRMARVGLPLDIISIVMVTVLTSILVPLIFGTGSK